MRNGDGGEFSNNTISAKNYDFVITDSLDPTNDIFFEVTNCTTNPSKVWFSGGSPTIIFNYFLHVNVTDLWGIAPNIYVEIDDESGTNAASGYTDSEGYLRWIELTNQTRTPIKTVYYDPYNITAFSGSDKAYGEIEPTMNRSQSVNVHFDLDLPPETPSSVEAVSNWTDVDVFWEPSYSPDLFYYLVFRNDTGSGWEEVYNTSLLPLPQRTWTNWKDPDAASTWTTYSYKVKAVDVGGQHSQFSQIARCGDWAVEDTLAYSDFSVQLNGSLIVLPPGNLTFKHVDLKFNNNNFQAGFGIDVREGGELYILDNDDDPQTTFDQSIISAVDPAKRFNAIINGQKFVIKNSKVTNCGSNSGMGFLWWEIEKNALEVILAGNTQSRGMYISDLASDVKIENNEFSDSFIPFLLEGSSNCRITGNTFTDNTFGIYMHNAFDNVVSGNIFNEHNAFPIFLFDSSNNTVHGNNFTTDTRIGVGIYGRGSNSNKIILNNFTLGENGIYIFHGGNNNNFSENNMDEVLIGIHIFDTSWVTIQNNNYNIMGESSLYIEDSSFIDISSESSNILEGGYFFMQSNNIVVSDITLENADNLAITLWDCSDFEMEDIFINSTAGGIGILSGSNFIFRNVTIKNSMYGVFGVAGGEWGLPPISNVELINSNINTGIQEAILLFSCENFVLYNTSLNATNNNFNLTYSQVFSMNTTYNQTRVYLNDSSISLNWLLDVEVLDWVGNPAPNTHIQIRKAFGTLVYDGYTDVNGYVRGVWLHERTQYSQSNETSNPHFVFADLGNHSGSETIIINISSQITVYLENSPPLVSNVILSPSYPTTIDNLTLEYQYSDPENDPEGNTWIFWYVDGVQDPSFNNQMTIDSGFISKGQTWFCEVIPHDGTVYGVPMTSTPVTIQNTPPIASNVVIDETNPRSSDNLHVNYTYFDIDDDPETWSQRKWMVNNGSGWVYSGVDSMELSSVYTKEGERWRCLVSPGDGDDYGTAVLSPEVIITNTAPEVTDVIILPESPVSNETLYVNYNYFDLDDDPESASEIIWYKDGVEQTDLYGSNSVAPDKTKQGEKWYYVITPSDGEDFGTPVLSESIIIGNTPPSVSNVIINPHDPDTTDELTVEYDYYDEDDDDESIDTIIKWYRKRVGDLEFTYTGHQGTILSSSFTTKGEEWMCVVTPHDGLDYGNNVNSSLEVTILNSPPLATDVYISPSEPTTQFDLEANYEYSDLDGDSEDGTTIIWYRNGNRVGTYDNTLTVPSEETQKDQIWYFSVQPKDGVDSGDSVDSPEIIIQNSPPTAVDLTISPSPPLGNNHLTASYTFYDEDGDSEQDPQIIWYKNGPSQNIDGLIVDSSFTEKGDLWSYTLIVFDGEDYSELISSYHVVIENSEPQLNEISPNPGQITLNETESWEFYVDIEDADGDLLLYKWKLNKATVEDDEDYRFDTDYESAGEYTLNLTVQDFSEKSGTLYFEWTIVVNNVNRKPEISGQQPIEKELKMKEDTSLKFSIEESDLDEEDILHITWYLDDVEAQSEGSSYTYHPGFTAAGKHTVTVKVSDGTDTSEYSWNLTVADVGEDLILGMNWDQLSIILEILVIAGTGLLAFIGYSRIRKKKGALKKYMAEIEEISEGKEEDPIEYENRLNDLDGRINDDFKQGNIEDLHFLMLQEIITTKRTEVRRATISQKFEKLPEGVSTELDDMLKDGKISREEYEGFVATISQTKSLTPDQRKELSRMIGEWEVEDKDSMGGESSTEKVKPEEIELDDKTEDKSESMDK
jgi:parallel beta-helix repeat protein